MSWLKAAPPWAIGIIAILLVGGSTLQSIAVALGPKPATTEQAEDIRADVKQMQKDFDEWKRARKQWEERRDRRDQITIEGLCKLNDGKPIARNAPCNELVWSPPPLGSSAPWTAREEWPSE